MSNSFQIDKVDVGSENDVFIIAEVGQAHDGSLGTAYAYIDAIASTGANAVKFQTHIAEAESTSREEFRANFSRQDKTRFDYWKRMEFTREQWTSLAEYTRSKGLIFLSSPFSERAVDLLNEIGCPAWKIGSGELLTLPLLEKVLTTNKPILLSSGMASWPELDSVVDLVSKHGVPFAVFQCTTSYPCPPQTWGLNVIGQLRERYGSPVGFSDHSGRISCGLAAVALGANIIEVHVTFSRQCFGPDVSSSLTLEELAELVKGAREIKIASNNPVDKDEFANKCKDLKLLFGKSVVSARSLSRGHVIALEDIVFKKPGTGIPASNYKSVLGKVLKQPINTNEFILPSDLDN